MKAFADRLRRIADRIDPPKRTLPTQPTYWPNTIGPLGPTRFSRTDYFD